MAAFRGFPAAAIDFYARLEADNSRSFWSTNKSVYDGSVRAPLEAFGELVEAEFGPLHLFRPQRDTRFSRDKTPYKTAQGAVTEAEGGHHYYLQISATGLFVGVGLYRMASDQLERYRHAVDDARKGGALARALDALRTARYEIGGRELKTAPRGYARDHPRVELLQHKGVTAGKTFGAPAWLHTRKAADRVIETWRGTAELCRWLERNVGPSTLPPE